MDKINSSLDWQQVRSQLDQKIQHFDYKIRRDLYIMFKNVDELVTELSTEEIQCRRQHKATRSFIQQLEKINSTINDINKMIIMGALL